MSISLKVKPGSRRPVPPAVKDGVLYLAVNAPPVDGKANAAVIAALSELFELPKSCFELTHGASGKQKRVVIRASAPRLQKAEEILQGLAAPSQSR